MGITDKKRRREDPKSRPKKAIRNFKKQKHYHSSSEQDTDEDDGLVTSKPDRESHLKPAVTEPAIPDISCHVEDEHLASQASDNDSTLDAVVDDLDELESDDDADDAASSASLSSASSNAQDVRDDTKVRKKRNDASIMSTSISKILASKLSSSKRADPVLARSTAATEASREVVEARLDMKARKQINAEKRKALDKGRVEDVLGLENPLVSTAQIQELEKRLKKTAQRGVVKLFNAVRAAQVHGEVARSEARKQGMVGIGQREERVGEMSKQGFLDLIAHGGKKPHTVTA